MSCSMREVRFSVLGFLARHEQTIADERTIRPCVNKLRYSKTLRQAGGILVAGRKWGKGSLTELIISASERIPLDPFRC